MDCCFIKLALQRSNSACWSTLVQRGHHYLIRQQATITHSLKAKLNLHRCINIKWITIWFVLISFVQQGSVVPW